MSQFLEDTFGGKGDRRVTATMWTQTTHPPPHLEQTGGFQHTSGSSHQPKPSF